MKSTELSVIRWARVNSMDPEWLANLVEEIRKRYLNVFSFDYRRAKSLYLTYKRLCEVMEEDFAVSYENVDVDEVYAEEFIRTVYGPDFLPQCYEKNWWTSEYIRA